MCVCGKVLTVLTCGRGDGGVRQCFAVSCGRLLLQKKQPKARSTNRGAVCNIVYIFFVYFIFCAFHTHIHMRLERANFIFIFIISLRHINKSHGHAATRNDGEKLKMILNN